MEMDSTCWVCSSRFEKGERVTRLPSLGMDVHAHCADQVLRSERPPASEPIDEDEDTAA
jgi:hypothetical protein